MKKKIILGVTAFVTMNVQSQLHRHFTWTKTDSVHTYDWKFGHIITPCIFVLPFLVKIGL